MDVRCAKCGEPWDSYSLQPGIYNDPEGPGDLTREEALRFRAGEGCPSCHFGERLTEEEQERGPDLALASLLDECEASDEDPIDILNRRGF